MSQETKSRAGRAAAQGATVVTGGLLLLGLGAGTAGAHVAPKAEAPSGGEKQQAAPQAPTGGDKQQASDHGSHDGDKNALVDISNNQIPIQICHNQVPVNVLGVQVPIQDVEAALGLGEGKAPVIDDSSCHQPSAQQN